MGIKVTAKQFTTPVSTGEVTWTDTNLGGLTPKAIMVIMSKAVTNGTADDDAVGGSFFWDAAGVERSVYFNMEDGVTTGNVDTEEQQTVTRIEDHDETLLVGATFVSFSANSGTISMV